LTIIEKKARPRISSGYPQKTPNFDFGPDPEYHFVAQIRTFFLGTFSISGAEKKVRRP